MSSHEDNTQYLQVETPHYNFEMKMNMHKDTRYFFSVGDDNMPDLEGSILLDDTVDLTTIDALYESSIEDINKDYLNAHTFGKEVLDAVIFLIKSQFPIIKTIILNDRSYIPYRTDTGNTLDLLTYSIGLYKKTWYEEKLNAYILPKEKHEEYRRQVEDYASKDTKDNIPFFHIYHIMRMNNIFARDIIWASMEIYEKMYEESETLPEFFQKLSKNIKLEEKCKFFKGWLPQLIHSKITLTREWHFDIYPKIKIIKEIK